MESTFFDILDQYIQESGFYFSPYGDIGLVNGPNNVVQTPKSRENDQNRDVLDLNQEGDIADELDNILKALDQGEKKVNAGESQYKNTLDEMIVKGKVKGLPMGTKPNIGLEQQGMKLPINQEKPVRNNFRVNPLQRPARQGQHLISKLQSALHAGKMKNANNFQRLPNVAPNCFTPTGFRHPGPNHQQMTKPPPLIQLNLLNSLNLDVNAYRNFMQKNKTGGLDEFMRTVSENLKSKYDVNIQRKIAEKQNKCLMMSEDGDFAPVSFDGPGVESECIVLGTETSLHSRFSAI